MVVEPLQTKTQFILNRAFQTKRTPMSKPLRLIITADDYGISPAVNQGIKEGIESKVINTVSVMMNFVDHDDRFDSAKNLEDLLDFLAKKKLLDRIALGIHLNITAGKPYVDQGKDSSLLNDDRFYTFDELKRRGRIAKIEKKELYRELEGQVKRFVETIRKWEEINQPSSSSPIVIDHLSNHHNILLSVGEFAEEIAKLSKKFALEGRYPALPIPVRRPIPLLFSMKRAKDIKGIIFRPTRKYIVKGKFSISNFRYYWRFSMPNKLRRLVKEEFNGKCIACPHAMYLGFFGKGANKDIETKLKTIENNLHRLYKGSVKDKWLSEGDTLFLEIVHHPCASIPDNESQSAETPSPQKQFPAGVEKLDYPLEYRMAEMETIKDKVYQEIWDHLKTVLRGQYSEMNHPENRIDCNQSSND